MPRYGGGGVTLSVFDMFYPMGAWEEHQNYHFPKDFCFVSSLQIPETGDGIFHGCQIVLDLDAVQVRFKQKQELRKKITDNGGVISYIITKKVIYFVKVFIGPGFSIILQA